VALTGRPFLGTGDENGSEIVDVGQSRTGNDLIAESLEEGVTVVVGQSRPGIDSARECAGKAVGCCDGSGNLFGPVHAVGIAGQREHARQAAKLDHQR
jgi:hypothetical protein